MILIHRYTFASVKKSNRKLYKTKKMSIRDNEPEWIRSLDHEFPNVGKELLKDYFKNSYRKIPYKKGICFRCNGITPKKIYCHPMYGGKFKQHYGWYINQEYYKLGIDKGTFTKMYVLPEECTPELYDSLQQINKLIASKKEIYDNDNEIRELRKSLERTIENSVREQLGFKKIGDAWISETMLYNIVKNLYPNQKIIRHYRPQWLDGLELDIFVPNLKIGLEYQGIQHFKAVEHWGGQKQLKKQQEHDTKKKKMCSELGINLVCINYDNPLTSEYVSKRILEQLEK